MPSLRELDVSFCRKLKQLPEHGLTSLTKLKLGWCACCSMQSLHTAQPSNPPACAQHKNRESARGHGAVQPARAGPGAL